MSRPADRHLLFGLLALQSGLIRPDQLVDAFHAWTADKDRSIDDHLISLGSISADQQSAMDALVQLHAEFPGSNNSAVKPSRSSTRDQRTAHADSDGDSTLSHRIGNPPEPDTTQSYSGQPTARDSGDRSPIHRVANTDDQRFRVLRPHAKGGLGAVFVADDTQLDREVALKQILDKNADNPRDRNRFLLEAKINGGLEHPGIVPVYALGIDADGRPYYAMRFIRGDSLRDAIQKFHQGSGTPAEKSLQFRRLLKCFTDVCNAIDYAHSKNILHRDIKPSNVILGNHGETLVVDWGVAKVLGQPSIDVAAERGIAAAAEGSSETLPGQTLGTPAFMSPEQACGDLDKLGTRSDAYSLGATLYCLITGKAPYEGSVSEILEAARMGRFSRPRAVDSTIDPALEAIVLKAMANDPADRYGSARSLADDVDRWLADERVEAYSESWLRGLIRWLTRHRTGVTGIAAAGIVALVGLVLISAVQTRARKDLDAKNDELKRANTELVRRNQAYDLQRQRAEENESQAIDAVNRFKNAVIDNPELKNNPDLKTLRKTLLQEPLAFFGKLRERLSDDNEPELLAKLADVAFTHAILVDEIGDKADAIQALHQAIAMFESLVRDHPSDAKYQTVLAISHLNLGNLLRLTSQAEDARVAYERAIEIQERLVHDDPADANYLASLALSRNNLGNLYAIMGQTDKAAREIGAAIAIRERLIQGHPTSAKYQAELATSRSDLGNLYRGSGRPIEAEAAFGKAVEIQERLVRDHPTSVGYQSDLAGGRINLGNLLRDTGRPDEARAAHQRAVEILELLTREHPAVTQYWSSLAQSHNNLGLLLNDAGRVVEAQTAYNRAIEIGERLAQDHPAVAGYQADLARSYTNLGILLYPTGRLDEARAAQQRAIEIMDRLAHKYQDVPDYASVLGASWHNMASVDLQDSRFVEARDRLLEAITWQTRALDANPRHPQYRRFYMNHLTKLIEVEQALGHDAEAERISAELTGFRLQDPEYAVLDTRLRAIHNGESPRNQTERLALAQRAYDTRQFRIAAKLWGEALDTDPNLADNRQDQHPYNAACAAAMAADGQGTDPPQAVEEQARLRDRALGWLRSERDRWSKILDSAQPADRKSVAQTLQHWQDDSDLVSVRNPDRLSRLSEPERQSWQGLWNEIADLLKRASSP